MESLLEAHRKALDAFFEVGRKEYGDLGLEPAWFARRVLDLAVARVTRDGAPLTGKRVAEHLGAISGTDLYLASACEAGTPAAWEHLAEHYYPRIKGLAMRYGAREMEAEEIARELPGMLLRPPRDGHHTTRLGGYDGSGTLFAWLARFVQNSLADRGRKRRPLENADGLREIACPGDGSPPAATVRAETARRVQEALKEALLDLSTRETLLLVWRFRDGLSQQQIAARLAVSAPRVSFLMKRAVERVRTSVMRRIQDASSAQWPARESIWAGLKDAVAELLERQNPSEPG